MEQRVVKARRQIVLPVNGRYDLLAPEVRGGKGTSLAAMHGRGLRVPPAFTVSTTAMRAFLATGVFPKRLKHQLEREMEVIERKTGKKFGDPHNPLLVSVRSGAATSMPGMMDTILNLGMSNEVREGFTFRGDAVFGSMLYERFTKGWQETARHDEERPIPNDPWEQLEGAILAVMRSWDNERARVYRDHHGVSHDLGTAVNVQAMVYGNRDQHSGTGVVFSHNVNTGDRGLYGEFLPCAQGEEVVSGARTPEPISALKSWNGSVYNELEQAVNVLAAFEESMVEVEFTVESGVLYFLQHRRAKASLEARITSLVHDVWAKRTTREEAIGAVSSEEVGKITQQCFEPTVIEEKLQGSVIRGIAASPGVASGRIVFDSRDAVEMARQGERVILVRPDTNPDDLPGMIAASGIITWQGGATCHAAVVARALGKPAIVGATPAIDFVGETISIDGSEGFAVPGIVPVREATLKKEVSLFKRWCTSLFPQPRFDYSWAKAKGRSVVEHLFHVYLLELMAHEAKASRIGHKVGILRRNWYVQTAELFGCYLVHAVAGELRHLGGNHVMNTQYPVAGGDEYRGYTLLWAEKASVADVCLYLARSAEAFRSTHTPWSAFGGKKWAVIAETALDFFEGRVGHVVFVDRVFDLEHHTGHVFNKHTMVNYHHYSSHHFTRLLDEKKAARTFRALKARWEERLSLRDLDITFDQQLLQLEREGAALNIWR